MSRSPLKLLTLPRALPIAVAVLIVLGLTPVRFLGWMGWFGNLASTLIAPISQPFAAVSRWVVPAAPRAPEDAVVRKLQEDAEQWRTLYLREQQENLKLQKMMEELYRLKDMNPDAPVRHVTAPVIGVSSDLSSGVLRVRAGEKQGLSVNTVAVAPGLQLLGRVVSAGARQSLVQPITSRAGEPIRGRVMVDDPEVSVLCQLEPVGDGTLRGPVFRPESAAPASPTSTPPDPAVGQTVRLDDAERWPRHAQMLILGRIEKVEPSPTQPLRKIVTVRPLLKLDRVSEVVLRVADGPESGGAGDGGAR